MNLLALLGGGKGKAEPPMGKDDADPSMGSGGPEDTYAREAFGAIKDGDEEGFVSAFLSAVRACSKASDTDETEPDEDDAED